MKARGKFLDNEAHNTGQFYILSFFATVLFPLWYHEWIKFFLMGHMFRKLLKLKKNMNNLLAMMEGRVMF